MERAATIRYACDDPRAAALKLRAQRELEAVRASFLVRRPFLAQMALQLDLIAVVDDRIRTAATNGHMIYFDARFFEASGPGKREFVFAHEVWHCALGHMSRAQNRNRHFWNLATDHEINVLLSQDGFFPPEDAVLFEQWAGLNAEEVYERLNEGHHELRALQTLDVHLPCAELPEQSRSGAGDPAAPMMFDRDVRMLDAAPSLTEASTRMVGVARRVARLYGTLPNTIAAQVDAFTTPKVDWRVAFAQFLERTADKSHTWSRPQRRLVHAGLHLPSRAAHQGIRQVVVAVDVSGSVLSLASRFLSEIRGMLQQVAVDEIDLLFFDTRICHRARITSETGLQSVLEHVRAGGGTAFEPVFAEIEARFERPSLLVLLTDGVGSVPPASPAIPVVWALTGGGSPPADWGYVLSIDPK